MMIDTVEVLLLPFPDFQSGIEISRIEKKKLQDPKNRELGNPSLQSLRNASKRLFQNESLLKLAEENVDIQGSYTQGKGRVIFQILRDVL